MLLQAGYAYVPYASLESVIEQSKERYYLFAREHGRVSSGDMVRLAGASRNTLKQQLRQLVERGYLTRHGGGRTTWYTLRYTSAEPAP
jgi:Fic family protein